MGMFPSTFVYNIEVVIDHYRITTQFFPRLCALEIALSRRGVDAYGPEAEA